MKEYNGHRSWNAWNVALWIGNDELWYNIALNCLQKARTNHRHAKKADENCIAVSASREFMLYKTKGERTPDGAIYNRLSVKLALLGLME